MKVVLFANNRLGLEIARRLRANDEIVAIVVHPAGRAKNREEIISAAGVPAERILDGSRAKEPTFAKELETLGADIGVSVLFGYILPRAVLDAFPQGIVNLHTSLLPWNRGAYPNVWSIVERTPAGVTIHYLDEGVDTGDIIAQREVAVEPVDTGATLSAKLENAAVPLFQEAWDVVSRGGAPRTPQQSGGSIHRVRDAEAIDRINLDRTYTARELIDLLRARTFPPYKGAYFEHDGRRVYLHLKLAYEDDMERI